MKKREQEREKQREQEREKKRERDRWIYMYRETAVEQIVGGEGINILEHRQHPIVQDPPESNRTESGETGSTQTRGKDQLKKRREDQSEGNLPER